MSAFKTCLAAVLLALPLLAAAAEEERKPLIERKPAGREPTTDQEFLVWAIACEVAEVKIAERAVENAEKPEVKKLAQRVLEDHKKTRDALMEQARKMKVGVVEGLNQEHREIYDRLGKVEGQEFDRTYLRHLVEGHEKGVKMYRKWAKDARDTDLRATAEKALSTAKDHLERAKDLGDKVKR